VTWAAVTAAVIGLAVAYQVWFAGGGEKDGDHRDPAGVSASRSPGSPDGEHRPKDGERK
jgi:hypothetical protein